jgi:hypothetical protein
MGVQPVVGQNASRQPAPCQIQSVSRMAEGVVPLRHLPLHRRARLAVKRRLSPRSQRRVNAWLAKLQPDRTGPVVRTVPPTPKFVAGDVVRVRPRAEIEASLDASDRLRGCGFMEEMAPYCSTTQTVLKPVQRFVDERDYKVKKARNVYLLDGVMCEGTQLLGPCDRGCLYFWRGEWLEPAPSGGSRAATPE